MQVNVSDCSQSTLSANVNVIYIEKIEKQLQEQGSSYQSNFNKIFKKGRKTGWIWLRLRDSNRTHNKFQI